MVKEIVVNEGHVASKIFEIRGQKVMLDRDLAAMYGVETRVLNQAVKRNSKRFPLDFMFQMSKEEFDGWKSQNVISNNDKIGLRKLPHAFTEQGVSMLSSVLNSETAIEVNIRIIRIFTRLRQVILTNQGILLKLAELDKKILNLGFDVKMHDGEIASIFELIKDIMAKREKTSSEREPIGFRIKQ